MTTPRVPTVWDAASFPPQRSATSADQLTDGSGSALLCATDISSSVQAHSATLDAIAATTWAGATSITTLGTISGGKWSASIIDLSHGGTNANLTATLGGVVYSTASAMAITAADTSNTRKFLRTQSIAGAAQAPAWDTVTATDVGLGTASSPTFAGLGITAGSVALPAPPSGTFLQAGILASFPSPAGVLFDMPAGTGLLQFRSTNYMGSTPNPTSGNMGGIGWSGYGVTGYSSVSAQVIATATETWTDTHHGTGVQICISPNGGTANVPRLQVDGTGVHAYDYITGVSSLTLGEASGTAGTLVLQSATAGKAATIAQATTTSYTLTLPPATSTAGSVLGAVSTDGVLSWMGGQSIAGLTTASSPTFAGLTLNTNTASPPTAITGTLVQLCGADSTHTIMQLDGAGTYPYIALRRASGTISSPTATQSGQALGAIFGGGYYASAYNSIATAVEFLAAENWTSSANGTYISFLTTTATTTTLVERMRIDAAGHVGINQTNPQYGLDLASTLNVTGTSNFAECIQSIGAIRCTGEDFTSAAGAGLELYFDGTNACVQGYNRTTPGATPLYLWGSSIVFQTGPSATNALTIAATGAATFASTVRATGLGIGTTAPTTGMSVVVNSGFLPTAGTNTVTIATGATTNNYAIVGIEVGSHAVSGVQGIAQGIAFQQSSSAFVGAMATIFAAATNLGVTSASELIIATNSGSGTTTALTLDSNQKATFASTVQATGYICGAGTGVSTTITTSSLVGKTITVTGGIITGFA